MRVIYHSIIWLMGWGIRLGSLFNPKAQSWIRGRKGLFDRLQAFMEADRNPVIWFHCASLGEFEQGRPLIENILTHFPSHRILLTFFSPSGYVIRKNYPGAGYVTYLPLDTPANARRFISLVQPTMVIFIKYEFWYNFLHELHKENIPVFFASALFHPDQPFFRWYGGWFRRHLRYVRHFFLQDPASVELLNRYGIQNTSITGDTRIDRVMQVALQPADYPAISGWAVSKPLLVAGSTWPPDETLLKEVVARTREELLFLIAPHEVNEERLRELEKGFSLPCVRFSTLIPEKVARATLVLVDGMGYLAHLYRYATIVYIGGGFGKGIHNILEAAAFGKPILFGPNYLKFKEAVELTSRGGAFAVTSPEEASAMMNRLLSDKDFYRKCAMTCKTYVQEHAGATTTILQKINDLITS